MKIIVEKDEANDIKFDPSKRYLVLENFNNSLILGVANISVENNIMYADIFLDCNFEGYPAICYDKKEDEKHLHSIGICNSSNIDDSIKSIKYKL